MYIFLHFTAHKLLMHNGNDSPARTPNLEFSDEKQKSLNSGLAFIPLPCSLFLFNKV